MVQLFVEEKGMKEMFFHKTFNAVDGIGFAGACLLAYHGFTFDAFVWFFLAEVISVAGEEERFIEKFIPYESNGNT